MTITAEQVRHASAQALELILLQEKRIESLLQEKTASAEGAALYERMRICESLSDQMEEVGMWSDLDWRARRDALMQEADLAKVANAVEVFTQNRGHRSPDYSVAPGAGGGAGGQGSGAAELSNFLNS